MISSIDDEIGFMRNALNLHAQRQQLLAGNIANADTPNYKAVDIDFSRALQTAMGSSRPVGLNTTAPGHLQALSSNPLGAKTLYRQAVQPSIDGNTVDMDVERAQFIDNAIRYQFALDRIGGKFKTMELALRGQ
jgi:flagellar basal-body rod protein FlgB